MLFTLEALPAAEGDCLLLHWGTAADPNLAVIDGGPGRIYEEHLRPRLDEIVDGWGVGQLPIELVMVSHMDSDHVVGIKKLVRALRREVDDSVLPTDRPLRMLRLWHNVFNDVLGDPIDQYYRTLTASYQASVGGRPNPQLVGELAQAFTQRHGDTVTEAQAAAWDLSLVLAGHGEGRQLRDDHKFLYDKQQTSALNTPFTDTNGNPTLIAATEGSESVNVAGLAITIAGPLRTELEALQQEFDTYIKTKGLTAEALVAAYADKSVKNLSSIVCYVMFRGKSILFTGDARGDRILVGLETVGLLGAETELKVDVLKVPHHGSDRNVEPNFFRRIIAENYVFSGDGKHGNPDRDTFQWLAEGRGVAAKYEILLTYPVAHIDENRRIDFEENGRSWDSSRDSLESFFQQARDNGYEFTVRAGAPVKVELGDERTPW